MVETFSSFQRTGGAKTFADVLRFRAGESESRCTYTVVSHDDGVASAGSAPAAPRRTVGVRDLWARARAVAVEIGERRPRAGSAAALVFAADDCLSFVEAFLGCLLSGVVSVPLPPPDACSGLGESHKSVLGDCGCEMVLSSRSLKEAIEASLRAAAITADVLAVDAVPSDLAVKWEQAAFVDPLSAAYLLYSGNAGTRSPRGIIATHASLMACLEGMSKAANLAEGSPVVNWLPLWQDAGLLVALSNVYNACAMTLMSPVSFFARPARWLQLLSETRAEVSAAPSYALDLCSRSVTPELLEQLDLAALHTILCSVDSGLPSAATLFQRRLARAGLRPSAVRACYGVHEASLVLTHSDVGAELCMASFDAELLLHGRVRPAGPDEPCRKRVLAAAGAAYDHEVAVVDTEDNARCADGVVGEVWVSGPSVAAGFWGKPEETQAKFRALMAGSDRRFLRTGDTGFVHESNLYIVGRKDDVIVFHDKTYDPLEVEATVQRHHAVRKGAVAAFCVEQFEFSEHCKDLEKSLVILAESTEDIATTTEDRQVSAAMIFAELRKEVLEVHGLPLSYIALVKTGTLPRTASGCVQRPVCKTRLLEKDLDIVAVWRASGPEFPQKKMPHVHVATHQPIAVLSPPMRAMTPPMGSVSPFQIVGPKGDKMTSSTGRTSPVASAPAPVSIGTRKRSPSFRGAVGDVVSPVVRPPIAAAVLCRSVSSEGPLVDHPITLEHHKHITEATAKDNPPSPPKAPAMPAVAIEETDRTRELEIMATITELLQQLVQDDECSAVGPETPFALCGLTSIDAIGLIGELEDQYNLKISHTMFTECPTPQKLARRLAGLSTAKGTSGFAVLPTCQSESGEYPLSSAQEQMWVLQQLDPETTAYHVIGACELVGHLKEDNLVSALASVVSRHRVLRTAYKRKPSGELVQYVSLPPSQARTLLSYRDLSESTAAERDAAIREKMFAPFDLARGPVFRALVVKVDEQKHIFVLGAHHIAVDGASMRIVISEVRKLYAGEALQAMRIQYADYAVWQKKMLDEKRQFLVERWVKELEGCTTVLDLPTDRPHPPRSSHRGGQITFPLPLDLCEGVIDAASHYSATMFSVMMACYAELVHRFTRQDDILIGYPVENRISDVSALVGYFVNTLVLRTKFGEAPDAPKTLAELVQHVHLKSREGQDLQQLPFNELVAELNVPRSSRTPLFQVFFNFLEPIEFSLGNTESRYLPIESGSTQFDLSVTINQRFHAKKGQPPALSVTLEYSTDVFDELTAKRMSDCYVRLLQDFANQGASTPLWQLRMLPEDQERVLLREWNNTQFPVPSEPLQARFEALALQSPDALCYTHGQRSVTRREMQELSTRVALWLARRGVKRGDYVCMLFHRSIEYAAVALGIIKSGAAYAPIDPKTPPARIDFFARDCAAPVFLCDKSLASIVPETVRSSPVFQVYDETVTAPPRDGEALPEQPGPSDVAVLLYTSGTTGEPKGVVMEHHQLVNYIQYYMRRHSVTPDDRLWMLQGEGWDMCVFDTFVPLSSGAPVWVVDDELKLDAVALGNFIAEKGLTVIFMPTAILEHLLEHTQLPKCLRVVCTAGDKLHQGKQMPIWNEYGPTEGGACTDVCVMPGDTNPTIGKPVDNHRVYIVDEHLQLVPIGAPGELLIGGHGVARGYHNRGKLTAEKFIADPFLGSPERVFRSGDLCRYRNDGNIVYMGRMDQQVKINGVRVELSEIEVIMCKHASVRQGVVLALPIGPGGSKVLVAYVVPSGCKVAAMDRDAATAALVEHLRSNLAAFVIPHRFVFLDEIPVTKNGKVDRAALPVPDCTAATEKFVEPSTELEKEIAELFMKTLKISTRISAESTFSELGGNSLTAVTLSSVLRERYGAQVPIQHLMDHGTVVSTAKMLGGAAPLASAAPASLFTIPAVCVDEGAPYALSSGQDQMWMLNQMSPTSAAYNVVGACAINGKLDRERLADCIGRIVQRHRILRTTYARRDKGLVQVAVPVQGSVVDYVDMAGKPEPEVRELVRAAVVKPFDLAAGPVFRATLVRTGDETYTLVMGAHHIAIDGASIRVIAGEIAELYEGRALPDLRIQYADYARWQKEYLAKEKEALVQRWKQELEGCSATLDLPTDKPYPKTPSFRGASHTFAVPEQLARDVVRLSRSASATVFSVMMACFVEMMHRYSRQDDVLVGYPVANRVPSDVEPLVGFFVNTLVLRTRFGEELRTFADLVAHVHRKTREGQDMQALPFHELVSALQVPRSSRPPLFQVLFNFLQATEFHVGGVEWRESYIDRGAIQLDLALTVMQGRARDGTSPTLACCIDYSTDLFGAATVQRMGECYLQLLASCAAARSEEPLWGLKMLPRSQEELLHAWNSTARNYPKELLFSAFDRLAAESPGALAVVHSGATVTRGQLKDASVKVALWLASKGVRRGSMVSILFRRSVEFIVCALGVVRAGAAYVPIDPNTPSARLEFIVKDSRTAFVLTDEALEPKVPDEVRSAVQVLCVRWPMLEVPAAPAGTVLPQPQVGDAAYMIYTSGTTGNPKGVLVEQHSIVNCVHALIDLYKITSEDVMVMLQAEGFDVCVKDTWLPLSTGAVVHVVDDELKLDLKQLVAYVERHSVTFVTLPHAVLENALAVANIPSCVRVVCTGGEKMHRGKHRDVWNEYGPTETTILCTAAHVQANEESPTIGRPIGNYKIYVVDAHMQRVPIGVPGELLIGGEGVARGYHNRLDLTSQKFIADPFEKAGRVFRSGDLCYLNSDGNLQFIGRIDQQVKVDGIRMELDEIEAVICKHPSVEKAVVAVRESAKEDGTAEKKKLVAYVVPKGEVPEPGSAAETALFVSVRNYLLSQLPVFMVPRLCVLLAALPLTSNGKIDRKALPEPRAASQGRLPESKEELAIEKIWQQALGVEERLGVDVDFFSIGGDSFLAATVCSEMRANLKSAVTMHQFFSSPTIAELANLISVPLRLQLPPQGSTRKRSGSNVKSLIKLNIPKPASSSPRRLGGSPSISMSARCQEHCRLTPEDFLAQQAMVLALLTLLTLACAPAILVTLLSLAGTTGALQLLLKLMLGHLLLVLALPLATLAVKRAVLPQCVPGEYPLWSETFCRWWLVHRMLGVCKAVSLRYIRGTPLLLWYLRQLGARVPDTVHFDTLDWSADVDLLQVGDNATIGRDVLLSCHQIRGSSLYLERISIGDRCTVQAACVVEPNVSMSNDSVLGCMSLAARGQRFAPSAEYAGSPSRPAPGSMSYFFIPHCAIAYTPGLRAAYAAAALFVHLVASAAMFLPLVLVVTSLHCLPALFVLPLSIVGGGLVRAAFYCSVFVAAKWLLVGRGRPRSYPLDSWLYLRKWVVDVMGRDNCLKTMSGTIPGITVLRALGAAVPYSSRVHSLWLVQDHDLVELHAGAFVGAPVHVLTSMAHAGRCYLDRVVVKEDALVPNNSALCPQVVVGAGSVVGCQTVCPPKMNVPAGTLWVGVPAVPIPQDSPMPVPPFQAKASGALLVAHKLLADLALFSAMSAVLLTPMAAVLGVGLGSGVAWKVLASLCAVPIVVLSLEVPATLLKWLLLSKLTPGKRSLTGSKNRMYGLAKLLTTPALALNHMMFGGTWVMHLLHWALGSKIKLNTYIDTVIHDYDLVRIGAGCVLEEDAVVVCHSMQDAALRLATVKLVCNCHVGQRTVLMEQSVLETCDVGSQSLVMQGETLTSGVWRGSPLKPAVLSAKSLSHTELVKEPIDKDK
eukprot:m51a1_g9467 putative amino acid adenylation domain-containing protein (3719) ;mRNA; f:557456-569215